ncbi:MAG: 50S ribosomal protein L29 [Bacteroidetes bacterium]|jgi:large subunit ribosomal protein L29|nr:50S ribosomal protein L29 [Bacteroidota bacterium]MBP6401449.1 50S ribosomal protein L29 [Bacteroidia bacterium]MBK9523326.1 50S ribosomal protein L29 [Bacteroidota bacterium]MBK9541069.1 50S ribosomal protein L29 [Bacteroidota bacterium]MBL0259052.1 50S ribosomal protein L29 [Bacteroidota bacterium]
MKQEDIRELTTDELRLRLAEEKTMYTKMKMNHAVSPIENPMKIRSIRRGIAMINTELTKRVNAEKNNS